jgi:hypothetical protein
MNFSSSIISDYTETFGEINSPEIKKQMRNYNLRYVYLSRSLENLNSQIESNIEPLRLIYYKELRENKRTKSLEIMNTIYKDERILACLDKMRASISIARIRVNEMLDINYNLIQLIETNLNKNQFKKLK